MRLPVLLSVYWFLLLGALGVFFPFYSLYLSENVGLSGTEVGLVMATIPLVGIVVQPLWGHTADRTGSRTRVLALLSFGASVGYCSLYLADGFAAVLFGTAAVAVCSAAVIPACVAVCFALLGERGRDHFGRVRVWGTIGFLVAVVGFPRLLDTLTARLDAAAVSGGATEPALAWMLPTTGALCLLAGLVALALPRSGAVTERAGRGDWRLLLGNRHFVRLLGFVFLSYLCLQGPMALFPLYVRSVGGSIDTISQMWIAMLVLEVPLVALSGAGFRRLGARGLLAAGVGSGALRWIVTALAADTRLVFAAQVLHGVTVTGLIIGAPLYVDSVVPGRLRATAQGMLSMVGVSCGGILSNIGAGLLVDRYDATMPALVGGGGALLLTAALPWLIPPIEKAADVEPVATPPAPVDPAPLA